MDKAHPPGPVILLVDDNPQNLQVLGNLLQEEKYEIEFAGLKHARNEWLGKKIDNWLTVSVGRQRSTESNDLNAKLIEFDKKQSFVLKDICLELSTSVREVEKIIVKSNDSNIKTQFEEIIKRMACSIVKLEKL